MNLSPQRGIVASALLLVVLVVLLLMAIARLGGRVPEFTPLKGRNLGSMSVPTARIQPLFRAEPFAALGPPAGPSNLFYTTFYQPPPPAPPPKAPTTKSVNLEFLGFFSTGPDQRQAFVQTPDGLVMGKPGGKIIGDLSIAAIDLKSLTLTNAAGQTNLLPFRVKTDLNIPLP
jgi:hypothetical protein